ncbi:MAG: hypothetical protein ACP5QJ_07510 [Thermosulfidibacteraceae bacterium]
MKYVNFLILFVCFCVIASKGYALDGMYEERTGQRVITNVWKTEGNKVVASNNLEIHSVLLLDDKGTILWSYQNFSEGTKLEVKREGNVLSVKGVMKNVKVDNNLHIDEAPWYQFVEASLRDFIVSEKKNTVFWIIKPADCSVFKMQAIREKVEEITIGGRKVKAIKVKITLTGIASLFWSVFYWYDENGVFLKYKGVKGGPGTPETIVERIM